MARQIDGFELFRDIIKTNFDKMCAENDRLYRVDIDADKVYEAYLNSYNVGDNPIYRKRPVHDCSTCRHFIKSLGNVVALTKDGIQTIWDVRGNALEKKYKIVANRMNDFISSAPIADAYGTTFIEKGHNHDIQIDEDGSIHNFDHFYAVVKSNIALVGNIHGCFKDVESTIANVRDGKYLLERGLSEITMDALDTALELIESNTLYRGAEHKHTIREFKRVKTETENLFKDGVCINDTMMWYWADRTPDYVKRLRNTSIGTFLLDLSNGDDLETALRKYEKIVAPENYKRPKAVFTAKMLDEAKKKLEELGYMESLGRRYANLDDITVNNILFCNRDSAKRVSGAADIFEDMKKSTKKAQKFDKVQTVSAEEFINNILPSATELSVYVENRHSNNFVSLIAPKNKNSKTMFKWNNNFSWAYAGNIADSTMKRAVEKAGGNVNAALRFSIMWNDKIPDKSDLDAHCESPLGYIYYCNKMGILDVDIIHPSTGVPAVENIAFTNRVLKNGTYKFLVNCYSDRGNRGFDAEVEFNGEIFKYHSDSHLRTGKDKAVATVTVKDGQFTIDHKMPCSSSDAYPINKWNIDTLDFVPVSVVCYSPNYWDEQTGTGNKHLLFMLNGCVNDENPNGFFNEYLDSKLNEHKRVFEALGEKMSVEYVDDQLSGVGFCLTKRNDIIVKVKSNNIERVVKVVF